MKHVSWSNVLAVLLALAIGVYFSGCAIFRPTPLEPPHPPSAVLFADEVLQGAFEIQRQYDVETVRCLTGYVVADTVFVAGMTPPWITHADETSVRFHACSAPNTIGWLHNHPSGWTEDGARAHYCEPSPGDITTLRALANFWVAVITCSDTTIIWQFKTGPAHSHTFSPDVYRISPGES